MRKNPVNKPRSPRPQAVGFWHLATLHGWCCHRLRGDVPGHWVGIEILGLLGSSRIDQTMRISTFFWGMHSVLHSYIIFSWVCPFGELTFVYSFTSTMFLTSVGCRRMCSRCGPSPQHCLRFCLSIWNWVAKDWKKGRSPSFVLLLHNLQLSLADLHWVHYWHLEDLGSRASCKTRRACTVDVLSAKEVNETGIRCVLQAFRAGVAQRQGMDIIQIPLPLLDVS